MRMDVWFSSDTHYGHANVIKYCNRPFSCVEEMDEAMISNWNEVVKPGDQVYHLGDFALCDAERATTIAKRLRGQKFIVWGNHDKYIRKDRDFSNQWAWTKDLADITAKGQRIVLLHYAMKTWNQAHRGSWQLHGHSHGSLKDDPGSLQLDVGVDCWNYRPVNFDEIAEKMKLKTFTAVDHHDTNRV